MNTLGRLSIQTAAHMVIADVLDVQNGAIAQQSESFVVFQPDQNRYCSDNLTDITVAVK